MNWTALSADAVSLEDFLVDVYPDARAIGSGRMQKSVFENIVTLREKVMAQRIMVLFRPVGAHDFEGEQVWQCRGDMQGHGQAQRRAASRVRCIGYMERLLIQSRKL